MLGLDHDVADGYQTTSGYQTWPDGKPRQVKDHHDWREVKDHHAVWAFNHDMFWDDSHGDLNPFDNVVDAIANLEKQILEFTNRCLEGQPLGCCIRGGGPVKTYTARAIQTHVLRFTCTKIRVYIYCF